MWCTCPPHRPSLRLFLRAAGGSQLPGPLHQASPGEQLHCRQTALRCPAGCFRHLQALGWHCTACTALQLPRRSAPTSPPPQPPAPQLFRAAVHCMDRNGCVPPQDHRPSAAEDAAWMAAGACRPDWSVDSARWRAGKSFVNLQCMTPGNYCNLLRFPSASPSIHCTLQVVLRLG